MFFEKILKHIDLACRLLLATVFVLSGVTKILDLQGFSLALEAYGMFPDLLIFPVALLLPPFEIALAVGLILNKRIALWASLGLMLLFIFILAYAMYLGLDIDCGCFATGDPETKAFSGVRSAFWRDIVLLLVLAVPCWRSCRKTSCTH